MINGNVTTFVVDFLFWSLVVKHIEPYIPLQNKTIVFY